MPIHDWSRKPVGLFHHFHQQWVGSICNALNAGCLPKGFYALLEQHAAGVIPDVFTLERGPRSRERPDSPGGIAVSEAPPKTRFMSQATDEDMYAAKAESRIVQEVARLDGNFAHVNDETIDPKHDAAAGEAWLHGRFSYMLYRHGQRSR